MKRRFLIAADNLSASETKAAQKYIETIGSWWHWIDNVWLVTTRNQKISAAEIRDNISTPKNSRLLVMEFPEDISWATRGQKIEEKDMADWLKKTWAGA